MCISGRNKLLHVELSAILVSIPKRLVELMIQLALYHGIKNSSPFNSLDVFD